jgi:hypothetical protein
MSSHIIRPYIRVLSTLIGLPVAITAAVVEPFPAVRVDCTMSGGQLPPKDPNIKVCFDNIGSGPMHVHNIRLFANGSKVETLTPLFDKESKYQITSESDIAQIVNPYNPWETRRRFVYLTARPNANDNIHSPDWSNSFLDVLKRNNVQVEVIVSSAASGPLCWVTKKTMVISPNSWIISNVTHPK